MFKKNNYKILISSISGTYEHKFLKTKITHEKSPKIRKLKHKTKRINIKFIFLKKG